MTRFTKTQKITIAAMIGFLLFNPFTVAVLEDWFKLVYTGVFMVCGAWLAAYVLYKALKPEAINIPKTQGKGAIKGAKKPKMAYIET